MQARLSTSKKNSLKLQQDNQLPPVSPVGTEQEIPCAACPSFVDPKIWMRIHYFSRIRRVITYLEQNLDEQVQLCDLASVGCMSRTSFSKLFKAKVGITLRQFLSAYRISKAHEMMTRFDLSITEIAIGLGFANLSTFERTFRRVTGRTPSEYRAGLLEQSGVVVQNDHGDSKQALKIREGPQSVRSHR